MRSFAPAERFVAAVEAHKLKPAYVFVGDEAFFRKQCRDAVLQHLVPSDLREFSFYEFDLAETELAEVLDRARTPSLMAPFQVFFVRGLKQLYGRGSHDEAFEAIRDYVKRPNPDAVIIFVADHLSIPADVRKMEMADRDRLEKIRDTLISPNCPMVELARVEENDAVRWVVQAAAKQGVKIDTDAARELVDSLAADMLLVAGELEKLVLYVGDAKHITLADVETMVLAAKQRSLYELTDAISARDRARALDTLQGLLAAGEGEEAAIGHLYMLAKTFRQMLVINEKGVRDTKALWQVLWPGFRVPPFAADDLVRQARRYRSRHDLERALRLVARADLALRSNPASKRLVLESLVLDLTAQTAPAQAASEHQGLLV